MTGDAASSASQDAARPTEPPVSHGAGPVQSPVGVRAESGQWRGPTITKTSQETLSTDQSFTGAAGGTSIMRVVIQVNAVYHCPPSNATHGALCISNVITRG